MNHENPGSAFYKIFNDPQRVRLLDEFLTASQSPIDVDGLHSLTNIPKDDIESHLDVLLAADLITTVTVDGDTGYKFNAEQNDAAQWLEQFHTSTHGDIRTAVLDAIEKN